MSMLNEENRQFCSYHPQVESYLRCKRCNKNICPKCAIPTPTGYICKDCEKEQQKKFDSALISDYIIAVPIAFLLSLVGSFIVNFLGFFVIIFSPLAGAIISEILRHFVKNRRSSKLTILISLSVALGTLPLLAVYLLNGFWMPSIYQGIYLILCTTTVAQRLKGILI
jgi:hypothetical protein